MKKQIFVLCLLVMCLMGIRLYPANQVSAQTQLSLTNSSNTDVTVYLTLGAVNGCTPNVKLIPFVTNYVNTLQGSFTLKQGETVSYTPPLGTCFNGNIAFGSAPLNCPPAAYPSGINLFEFMLNNRLQGAGAQETIDISCVAGANAYIAVTMSGGGTWNAGPGYPNVTTFKNNNLCNNSGQVGVYPYACDTCTASVNPPICPNRPICPIIPQKTAICNVQRNASNSGGTVNVSFQGWIVPTPPPPPPNGPITGGWTPYSCSISPEAQNVFNTALKGLLGVNYTPLTFSTQLVAGTNYSFFCNKKGVYPNAPNEAVIIDIFAPLQGSPHITSIKPIIQ
jgi:hypothetical protein